MTWVDGVILAVLALSGLVAYARGLVREVLGVGAWVGALVLAFVLLPGTRGLFEGVLPQEWMAEAAALAAVFVATLLLLKLVIAWVANRVRGSALGGVDRALGLVFGVARGAFLVLLAYIVAGAFLPVADRWPEPVRQARLLPAVAEGASAAVAWLPPDYRPALPRPPASRAPTVDDLLRPPARRT